MSRPEERRHSAPSRWSRIAWLATLAACGALVGAAVYLRPSENEEAAPGYVAPSVVSFYREVQPIFDRSCATETCHGAGAPQANLSLIADVSYVNLLQQLTVDGTSVLVEPGNIASSVLSQRVFGATRGPQMPLQGPPLSEEEINTIWRWIQQGAPEDRENKPIPTNETIPSVNAVADLDPSWPRLTLEPVVDGFTLPTSLAHAGDGTGRLFVTEQAGLVRVVEDGRLLDAPFLDLRDRVRRAGMEDGLLNIEFPPGDGRKSRFYVSYTDKGTNQLRVSQFAVSLDNPNLADPTSERLVLAVPRQDNAPDASTHYGGDLAFGPDDYLYISTGDGSAAFPVSDPSNVAQDLGQLLGKVLRIDVSGGESYRIPPDNPFAETPGARPEIWAYGLRNPWRMSFDRQTGDLFIGNVGNKARESIYHQPASAGGGQNYGWSNVEGTECLKPDRGCGLEFVRPAYEYAHFGLREEDSVIGGYVYKGPGNCRMQGAYIFGDWLGALFAMRPGAARGDSWSARLAAVISDVTGNPVHRWETQVLVDQRTPNLLSSFGEGEDGTLYALVYRTKGSGAGGALVRVADPDGPNAC